MFSAEGSTNYETVYTDDVFSTYSYTGDGNILTLDNGIALASKGGMYWVKRRSGGLYSAIWSSSSSMLGGSSQEYGAYISTTETVAKVSYNSISKPALSGTGFNVPSWLSTLNDPYVCWSFRRAPKFFDVVSWTGNDASSRVISHSLQQSPGCIIVKNTSSATNWVVYHKDLASQKFLYLNTTAIAQGPNSTLFQSASVSDFTVGNDATVNGNGSNYVAYLFAHDSSSTGLIQCGSFTAPAGIASITLGWEPQFVMTKCITAASNWTMHDNLRGMPITGTNKVVYANTTGAEYNDTGSTELCITPNAKGFDVSAAHWDTYIFVAVRRSNKLPTSGTNVFTPSARTGNGTATTTTAAGFATDLAITKKRSSTNLTGAVFTDRLRGATRWLDSTSLAVETTTSDTVTGFDNMSGITLGVDATTGAFNTNSHTYVDYYLKRVPRFLDIVCYTGTGTARSPDHNLDTIPELIIVRSRSDSGLGWPVYSSPTGNGKFLQLNDAGSPTTSSTYWNDTTPTSTKFTVGSSSTVNGLAKTYVAYLFATLAGVSKVGSYTGNGSSQTINCGFSTGARFILIKRTDTTGDWFLWDTARGINTDTDPHLSLNTTAAEVTTDDSIDSNTAGFIVNQLTATNINVNTATYIFLAIA